MLLAAAGPHRCLHQRGPTRRSTTEVRKVERPIGFADIVERVKPSVISVKINIAEKTTKGDDSAQQGRGTHRSSPARRWSASSGGSAVRMACRPACAVDRVAAVAR